jgi:circadian clock protein KaiB
MKKAKGTESPEEFEKSLQPTGKGYVLRLYVTGMTPRSINAIENIKKICEENLQGRYELEVIDIYQQPQYAKQEQILAAPTLIKKLPLPLRKFIGDMSDKEKILIGLNLVPKKVTIRE